MHNISERQHVQLLSTIGWTPHEWEDGQRHGAQLAGLAV